MKNRNLNWLVLLGISAVFYLLEIAAGGDSTVLGDLFGIIGLIFLLVGSAIWAKQSIGGTKHPADEKRRRA